MIGQKIALLFSCLALVAGRTVDKQTATPSTLEGFSGELHTFWKTILDSSDSGFVKDCKKGKCWYCRSIEKHDEYVMSCAWSAQYTELPFSYTQFVTDVLINGHISKWNADVNSHEETWRTYKLFRVPYETETYCKIAMQITQRSAYFCDNVCFVATSEKDSIVLNVALDVFQMTEIVIKDSNPTDICTSPTTDILLINNLCIQIKDANLQRASGCIFVAFEVYREKYSQKVLCFEIPTSDDTSQAL